MVIVVLILNGLIALLCLYAAWQICRWRSILARAADALTAAERSTHRVLHHAPQAIATGQIGTSQLRQQYRVLSLQLQQVQQILSLLGLGQLVWQQYRRNFHRPKSSTSRSHYRRDYSDSIDSIDNAFNLKKESQRRTSAKSTWMP